jgi:hypothetical protein
VAEVLPLLYLHGLSGNDFTPALEHFLGTSSGLSAATVTRLTVQWQDEARAFQARDLRGVDYVYVWADGVHVNVRLDEERLCLLVLIGVRTSDCSSPSEGRPSASPGSARPTGRLTPVNGGPSRTAPDCAGLRRTAPDCAGLRRTAPDCAGLRRTAAYLNLRPLRPELIEPR